MITLRPYQERAVVQAGELVRNGARRILLVLPTGGGKTVIAARVLSGAVAKGKRALFLAHRAEIVAQSYWKLHADGVPLASLGIVMRDGVIADATGKRFRASNPGAPAQVASIQTLAHRKYPPADVVFVDEAHHAAADTWAKLIAHYVSQGAVVVGLTATPVRSDGRGLSDLFDEMVLVETTSNLIAGGYLVRPRTFSSKTQPDLGSIAVRAGDFVGEELSRVMRQKELVGNVVETWKAHHDGRTTVVFAVDVAHSLSLVERFRAEGFTAEHLDGETDPAEREAILGRMARGETQVVSNAMVLTEGWDLPRAKVCVMARPTLSAGLWWQCVGRVMRPYGDVPATVLCHTGNVHRHGLPGSDVAWTLQDTTKPREKKAKKASELRECPSCGLTQHPAVRQCEHCGAELAPEKAAPAESNDTLVEITQAAVEREATRAAELRILVRKAIGRILYAIVREAPHVGTDALWKVCNNVTFRRLRMSRNAASAALLEGLLEWVNAEGGNVLRDALLAVVRATPVPEPVEVVPVPVVEDAPARPVEPVAPRAVEPQRQLGLAGIAPTAAPARGLPRAPTQAAPTSAPVKIEPAAMRAIERAEAQWRVANPDADADAPWGDE